MYLNLNIRIFLTTFVSSYMTHTFTFPSIPFLLFRLSSVLQNSYEERKANPNNNKFSCFSKKFISVTVYLHCFAEFTTVSQAVVFNDFTFLKGTVRRDVRSSENGLQTIWTEELYNRFASFLNFKETPSQEKHKTSFDI